jgi:hypothetical protein
LSYYLKFKGKPDITNNFIIKKLVNGDTRLAAGPDIHRPITVTVLGHLLQALAHVTKAYYQRIMFEAMFLLACFAFLRIGDITSCSNTYHLSKNISIFCMAVLYVLLVLGAIAASRSSSAVLIK